MEWSALRARFRYFDKAKDCDETPSCGLRTLDQDRSGRSHALRRQLYEWFRRAIADGRLAAGQRVPSSRSLAEELKVSRLTVVCAYEQLEAEGYLQTFRGAGTCIAASIPELLRPGAAPDRQGRKAGRAAPGGLRSARQQLLSMPEEPAAGDRGRFSGQLAGSRSFPAPRVVAADIAPCAQRFHQGHGVRRSHGRAASFGPRLPSTSAPFAPSAAMRRRSW